MEKTKNPLTRFGNWCADTAKWLFDGKDWKMLFRSIPGIVTALFFICTISMNLAANKIVWSGIAINGINFISITGGVFLSWAIFLLLDVVTRTFGAKATVKLTLLGAGINALFVGFIGIIASVPSDFPFPGASDAFNAVFGFTGEGVQPWQILLSSSIAYIISGILNALINEGIGKLFKKDPNSRLAFYSRSYISTMIGQFIDNFIFTGLAFGLIAGYYNVVTIVGMSLLGAIIELLCEILFSPLGYRVCRKWQLEGIGKDYLDYCKEMEVNEDKLRVNY